jgi:hypothetical protein
VAVDILFAVDTQVAVDNQDKSFVVGKLVESDTADTQTVKDNQEADNQDKSFVVDTVLVSV